MTDEEWAEYQALKQQQEENKKAMQRQAEREAYRTLSEEAGIEMVKAYLETLGTDEESQKLVRIILDLLSENSQGEIEPDKILQLDRYAEEFGSDTFAEGVRIIKESLRFDWTKYFFRAEEKDEAGAWRNVPLAMINI